MLLPDLAAWRRLMELNVGIVEFEFKEEPTEPPIPVPTGAETPVAMLAFGLLASLLLTEDRVIGGFVSKEEEETPVPEDA